MKEQAIKKINKIGKISSIITLICKIAIGMGMGIMLLAAILFFAIPKGSIQVDGTKKTVVEVDVEKFGQTISEADAELIKAELAAETTGIELDGDAVSPEYVEVIDNIIRIGEKGETFSLDMHDLSWMILMVLLMLALVMVTLCFIGSLCKAFRDCRSPFEENVIQKMQRFAYALIPWTIASSMIDSVGNGILSGRMDFNFSLDIGMILIVLVVFLLTYIFKYGAVLQQESDETL